MDLNLYAIYDKKAQEFGNPFTDTNDWLAIRRLNTEIKNPQSVIIQHSADFALYRIGKYDTKNGLILSEQPTTFVEEITNILKKQED